MIKKVISTIVVLLFLSILIIGFLVFGKTNDKSTPLQTLQVVKTDQINEVKFLYAIDDRVIDLIVNLRGINKEVLVSFINETGSGVMLGEGNALMKLGEIKDETVFVPNNNGIVFWSQLPARILGEDEIFNIIVQDAESLEVMLDTSVYR